MQLSSVATTLLSDRTFDIEFNGYLSNHAKHAIIALEGLQASPDRVQEYWDQYTTLTPYNLPLHKVTWSSAEDSGSLEQWNEWRGQKLHWPEQVQFMNRELEQRFRGNVEDLVREYATSDLLAGQAGALTHGIIHLGWAIDANEPWMISEGLAYLNFCHLSVDESKFEALPERKAETGLWDSVHRVACAFEKENLANKWVQTAKDAHNETFHPELVAAGFQWQLSKVIHDAHPVATQLPAWLDSTSVDELWESLYKDVVKLYLATRDDKRNGKFLILHAISSLWGLEHTLRVVDNEVLTRQALRQYYSMLICLLATSGFPASRELENTPCDFTADSKDLDWGPMVNYGTAEVEEHNIKLVYVTRELWRRYDQWSGFSEAAKSFTVTPNIGPSSTSFSGTS